MTGQSCSLSLPPALDAYEVITYHIERAPYTATPEETITKLAADVTFYLGIDDTRATAEELIAWYAKEKMRR